MPSFKSVKLLEKRPSNLLRLIEAQSGRRRGQRIQADHVAVPTSAGCEVWDVGPGRRRRRESEQDGRLDARDRVSRTRNRDRRAGRDACEFGAGDPTYRSSGDIHGSVARSG